MGYKIPWHRLTEAERQRRNAAKNASDKRDRDTFKAQLAEIEAENARREADLRNRDLIE
jgi:hypothetical protein